MIGKVLASLPDNFDPRLDPNDRWMQAESTGFWHRVRNVLRDPPAGWLAQGGSIPGGVQTTCGYVLSGAKSLRSGGTHRSVAPGRDDGVGSVCRHCARIIAEQVTPLQVIGEVLKPRRKAR